MLCHGFQLLAGEKANFVPGVQKGALNLVDEQQFLYHGSRNLGGVGRKPGDFGRFRWRCVEENSEPRCPASAYTELSEGEGEVERLVGKGKFEHNHPSDPGKVGGNTQYHWR